MIDWRKKGQEVVTLDDQKTRLKDRREVALYANEVQQLDQAIAAIERERAPLIKKRDEAKQCKTLF